MHDIVGVMAFRNDSLEVGTDLLEIGDLSLQPTETCLPRDRNCSERLAEFMSD